MKQPNERLRRGRQRTLSPPRPGECLSGQEIADGPPGLMEQVHHDVRFG
jgi:hypothetical protein